MDKLSDSIMIKRPISCNDCPCGFVDSDEGDMCCGHKRDYGFKDGNIKSINSPEDALKYGAECLFVVSEEA